MGLPVSRAGKLRGSLPNVNSTALSTTIPPATVAISQALEPRDANGRTSVRSTSRPKAAHSSRAAAKAAGIGQPSRTANIQPSTAPSMTELPCEKLTVLETT